MVKLLTNLIMESDITTGITHIVKITILTNTDLITELMLQNITIVMHDKYSNWP